MANRRTEDKARSLAISQRLLGGELPLYRGTGIREDSGAFSRIPVVSRCD